MEDRKPTAAEIERKVPRSFMSPAYVERKEHDTYAMYRDILVETDQPDGVGGFFREKLGKRIGPMMLLRRARTEEEAMRPDFVTDVDGQPVPLIRTWPPLSEEERAIKRIKGTP